MACRDARTAGAIDVSDVGRNVGRLPVAECNVTPREATLRLTRSPMALLAATWGYARRTVLLIRRSWVRDPAGSSSRTTTYSTSFTRPDDPVGRLVGRLPVADDLELRRKQLAFNRALAIERLDEIVARR
jgi:hypothetical protein